MMKKFKLDLLGQYQFSSVPFQSVVTVNNVRIPIDHQSELSAPALTLRAEIPLKQKGRYVFGTGVEAGLARREYTSYFASGYGTAEMHFPHNAHSVEGRLGCGIFSTIYGGQTSVHQGVDAAMQINLNASPHFAIPVFFGARFAIDGTSQVSAGIGIRFNFSDNLPPSDANVPLAMHVLDDSRQKLDKLKDRANAAIEGYGLIKDIDLDGMLIIAEEEYGKWFLRGTERWGGFDSYQQEKNTIESGLIYAMHSLKGNVAMYDDVNDLLTDAGELDFYVGAPLLRMLVEHEYSAFYRIQEVGKSCKSLMAKKDYAAAKDMFASYKENLTRLQTVVQKIIARIPQSHRYIASAQMARLNCWSKGTQCSGDVDTSLTLITMQRGLDSIKPVEPTKEVKGAGL